MNKPTLPSQQSFRASTEETFALALRRLQRAVSKFHDAQSFETDNPEFQGDLNVEQLAVHLQTALESLIFHLSKWNQPPNSRVDKVKDLIQGWVRSCYPFALAILMVLKEGSNVLNRALKFF
jgi:hypothetical protein